MRLRRLFPAVVAVGTLVPAAVAGATTSIVTSGIDDPRGLALAQDGTLFVASAGRGGKWARKDVGWIGPSGQVLSIRGGSVSVVAEKLPSLAESRDGDAAEGPTPLALSPDGALLTATPGILSDSLSAWPPVLRRRAGAMLSLSNGSASMLGNLDAFAQSHTPSEMSLDKPAVDPGTPDIFGDLLGEIRRASPQAIVVLNDGVLVADDRSQAVFNVRADTVSVYSERAAGRSWSPTAMAIGPDGSVYVGDDSPKAHLWRIPTGGGRPSVVASGFSTISGLSFAPDGSLYVVEHFRKPEALINLFAAILTAAFTADVDKPGEAEKVAVRLLSKVKVSDLAGAVIRVAPDGSRRVISDKRLFFPAGAAADSTGVYVSEFSGSVAKPKPATSGELRAIKQLPKAGRANAQAFLAIGHTPGRILHITP